MCFITNKTTKMKKSTYKMLSTQQKNKNKLKKQKQSIKINPKYPKIYEIQRQLWYCLEYA